MTSCVCFEVVRGQSTTDAVHYKWLLVPGLGAGHWAGHSIDTGGCGDIGADEHWHYNQIPQVQACITVVCTCSCWDKIRLNILPGATWALDLGHWRC